MAGLPAELSELLEEVDEVEAIEVQLEFAVKLRISRTIRTAAREVRAARTAHYGRDESGVRGPVPSLTLRAEAAHCQLPTTAAERP